MALAVFDRVVAVVENAVETFVQVRDVVATVEVVIDEYFPVAVEVIMSPLEPVKSREIQFFDLFREIRGEKVVENRISRITPEKSGVPFNSPSSE
jgi:hypothetical protein